MQDCQPCPLSGSGRVPSTSETRTAGRLASGCTPTRMMGVSATRNDPAMSTAERYLRPNVIAQVGRLDLRAKFIVEGFLSGLHASPFQGFSVEFSEHRKYTPGDDLKDLDWNVFAKTDRYYVRKYQAETNVTGYLVMDLSASMD